MKNLFPFDTMVTHRVDSCVNFQENRQDASDQQHQPFTL